MHKHNSLKPVILDDQKLKTTKSLLLKSDFWQQNASLLILFVCPSGGLEEWNPFLQGHGRAGPLFSERDHRSSADGVSLLRKQQLQGLVWGSVGQRPISGLHCPGSQRVSERKWNEHISRDCMKGKCLEKQRHFTSGGIHWMCKEGEARMDLASVFCYLFGILGWHRQKEKSAHLHLHVYCSITRLISG